MKPEKEKWINDVLGSLGGLQRAEPSPFLFAKIRNRLNQGPAPTYIPVRTVWLVATSFVLLLLLNWRVIHRPAGFTQAQTADLTTVIRDMNLYPTITQPYDVWSGQNY